MVARRAHNPEVGGSSPPSATRLEDLHNSVKIFCLSRNIYCIVRLRKCLLANLTTHYTFNHMNGGMSGGMEKADGPDSKFPSPFNCGFTLGRTRSFEVQVESYIITFIISVFIKHGIMRLRPIRIIADRAILV